jgi:hypothetical protein
MIICGNVDTTAVAMIQATSEPIETPTERSLLEYSSAKHNIDNIYISDILKRFHSSMNNVCRELKKTTMNSVGGQYSEAQG